MTEIEQKRKLLWEKLCARETEVYSPYRRVATSKQRDKENIQPNCLPYGTDEILLKMLVRRQHAFVFEPVVSNDVKSEIRIILKAKNKYEFSIGRGLSNYAHSSLFEVAADVLTLEEISRI